MREIIYAVVDRLNNTLEFDGIPNAQEEYAQLFEIHSNTEEYTITFYGQCIWSTVHNSIPEDDEIETIFKLCLDEIVSMRSALLHITSTIPNKAWVQ